MNTHEEVMLWHALYQLETRYWHEVDANGGRNAHEFYLPDGLMVVGHNRFQGRDKIKEFYTWRERQAVTAISSVKTTRHLVNNLLVESSGDGAARVLGIVSFYGAGRPAPGAAIQAADADRGPVERLRAGSGQGMAVQVTYAPAGVHEPRGAAVHSD
jgi:hypothetical protein